MAAIYDNFADVVPLIVDKARQQKKSMEKASKRAAMDVFEGIVNDTPQDTGFLMSNWRVRRGRMGSLRTKKKIYKKNYKGRISKVLANGIDSIQRWDFGNEDLYFVNATEYAEIAEDIGWRYTPPYMMMKKNVAKLRDRLNYYLKMRAER